MLDTCPRMVDKVLMPIPLATDVVAKVWRRSWNLTFFRSYISYFGHSPSEENKLPVERKVES